MNNFYADSVTGKFTEDHNTYLFNSAWFQEWKTSTGLFPLETTVYGVTRALGMFCTGTRESICTPCPQRGNIELWVGVRRYLGQIFSH